MCLFAYSSEMLTHYHGFSAQGLISRYRTFPGSTIQDARQERDASFRGARSGQLLTHLSCFALGGSEKGKPMSSSDPSSTERMAGRRALRYREGIQMGSPTGESGLVAGKVVVVMAARRAWEASPLFFSTSARCYQEVCAVLFRLFPNFVFAFSMP